MSRSKRILIFALAVALIALAVYFMVARGKPQIAYGNDILTNGDFESITGEGLPEGWYTDAYIKSATLSSFEVSSGKEGNGASIINRGLNDARFFQTVPVYPNTVYCLEADVLAEAHDGKGANLSVADVYTFSKSVYSSGGDWQHITLYGLTNSDQRDVTIFARLGGYSGESMGMAVFDNVRLYPVQAVPSGEPLTYWFSQQPAKAEEMDEEVRSHWLILLVTVLCYTAFALIVAGKIEVHFNQSLTSSKYQNQYIWAVLLLAALVRWAIAIVVPGYGVDIGCFTGWANRMAEVGPAMFYRTDIHSDYPPGYMLALWPLGVLGRWLGTGATEWMVKQPPILCDVLAIGVLYRWMNKKTRNTRAAWLLALLYALNPLIILTGAGWGQVDSVTALFIMLVVIFAMDGKWKAALPLYVVAVLMKPQALMFGPLGAVALITDMLWRKDKGKLKDVLIGVGLALAAASAIVLPFSVHEKGFDWLIDLYTGTMSFYDKATVNATNLYFLFGKNWTDVGQAAPFVMRFLGSAALLVPSAVYVLRRNRISSLMDENRLGWSVAIILIAAPALAVVVFPVSFAVMGTLLMVSSFAAVTWQYARGRDIRLLPLLGAILLILFSSLGVMMHERYMFPALLLLMMAYAFRRDKRLFVLMLLVTFIVFLNVGVVLDRGIRIGGSAGHLDAPDFGIQSDSAILEYVLSALGVLMASLALYLGFVFTDKSIENMPFSTANIPETQDSVPPGNRAIEQLKKAYALEKTTRRDWLIAGVITLLYAVLALTNLGSTDAPQNAFVSRAIGEEAVIDLGESREFNILYYPGIHWGDQQFGIETSFDNETWTHFPAQAARGDCFTWKYHREAAPGSDPLAYSAEWVTHYGRYVKVVSESFDLTLIELLFRDAVTLEPIVPRAISDNAHSLIDEQDSLEGSPSWFNSMYFDEIYHARTAYEQLNGLRGEEPSAIYETTHPPLGKAMMTMSIMVFGMTPFGWRFAGAMAGVLMLPGMYLMARLFTKRRYAALLAILFMAFDCMHFAQTRIATIDSFVTLFIIWATYFMFRYVLMDFYHTPFRKTLIPLGLSGLFMGLAVASKWTGCYAGLGLGVMFFWSFHRRVRQGMEAEKARGNDDDAILVLASEQWKIRALRTLAACLIFFVLIPALIYYLSFYPVFVATPGGLTVQKVLDANRNMFNYHNSPGLGMDHPYYSAWYKWPVSQKPMWYYSSKVVDGLGSTIFAFGNPVVWWVGLGAIVFAMVSIVGRRVRLRPLSLKCYDGADMRPMLMLIAFAAQYLPWVLVSRGTYIYHYFPAVPFIILATSYCLDRLHDRIGVRAKVFAIILMVLAWVLFVGFYPYVSGLRAPTQWLDLMKWFPGIWY
ncbi:MAG: phospholipid carrier-dependent glycosyltransferase [Clostridiales bacterium]|nr:phospholipid carrier-dependent glycosyltransferase [Clostridiales bacterium]